MSGLRSLEEVLANYAFACSKDYDRSGDEWDAQRLADVKAAQVAVDALMNLAFAVDENLIVTGSSLGDMARAAIAKATQP